MLVLSDGSVFQIRMNCNERADHDVHSISRKENLQKDLVLEVLKLADCSLYHDVNLICSDGSEKLNSFLLSAVFPVFRAFLGEMVHYEEVFISLPDVVRSEVKNLFADLIDVAGYISPGDSVKFLLAYMKNDSIESKEEVERDPQLESHLNNVQEAVVDFADLDPLLDDIKTDIEFFGEAKDPLIPKEKRRGVRKPNWLVCTYDGCNFTSKKSRMEGHLRCHEKEAQLSEENTKKRECFIENCDFKATATILRHHLQTFHADLKPECNQCDEEFSNFGDVLSHIIRHHNKYTCKICGKSIAHNGSKIRNHILTHTNENVEVECDRCQKKFKPQTFNIHKCFWKQDKLRKKVCNICGKMVTNLDQHLNYNHSNDEIKMSKCQICGKNFKKNSLWSHLKTHQETKCCPICGLNVRKLREHIQSIHTPEEDKRFHCQDCGKGFHTDCSLQKHRVNVHLKTYPYQCRYGCEAKYNDPSNRISHEKKKHGGIFKATKEQDEK